MRNIEVEGRRATLTITRVVPCTPERLWPWLTEPSRVQRWSSAPLELNGPFTPGTDRIVRLRLGPLPLFTLHETLVAVEPARGFSYQGRSVRDHRGRVQLKPLAGQTQLTWTASFRAPLAPFAWPMATFIHWQLGASLDQLARLAA